MRRPLAIMVLLAATWFASAAAACEDGKPPPPPIQRELEKATHERWGSALMSDGTRYDGLVATTRGKRLRIFDRKKSTYRDIKWKKIERIEQHPDAESFEREWRWLEGGNDVKVYTDRYYRLSEYRTVLVLRSGEQIGGDCVAPIYVRTAKKRHALELRKKEKSPKPAAKKDLKPLVYLRKLLLTDTPPAAKPDEPNAGKDKKEAGKQDRP